MADKYDQCKLGGPVHFHYVAPSFWAWKGGEKRLGKLAKFVDHVFCILPNEEEVCKLNGLGATFVGHPLLEDALLLNQVNVDAFVMNPEFNLFMDVLFGCCPWILPTPPPSPPPLALKNMLFYCN